MPENLQTLSRTVLTPGRAQRLALQAGRRLRVESGTIWLTQSGNSRDLFLRAGECFEPPRLGDLVVETLRSEPAVIVTQAQPALWRRLLAALAGGLRARLGAKGLRSRHTGETVAAK